MNISTMEIAKPKSELASVDVRQLRKILRAYDHSVRRWMIDLLHENEELTVTDIYTRWSDPETGRRTMEQSVCSQHLAKLRKAELVKTDRIGKHVFYSLNTKNLECLSNLVDITENCFTFQNKKRK